MVDMLPIYNCLKKELENIQILMGVTKMSIELHIM